MTKKMGIAFEDLTESIFRNLTNPNIHNIERNVRIDGPDGKREIDILITYITQNIEHRTIIECKDYNKPLTVEKLDAIASKMQDVKANKAIMVTRTGYSKQSKSKAKRLNIDIFTAHQALSEKWEIKIDLPILVTEITPHSTLKISVVKNQSVSSYISTFNPDNFEVNDINVVKSFEEKWNNQEIIYSKDESTQIIDFQGIQPPYFIKNKFGENLELSVFKIVLILEKNYFIGNIKEIEGSQLLKNSLNNQNYLFVKDFPFNNYRRILTKSEKENLPDYDSIVVNIINTATLSNLAISKVEGYNN